MKTVCQNFLRVRSFENPEIFFDKKFTRKSEATHLRARKEDSFEKLKRWNKYFPILLYKVKENQNNH